MNFIELTHPTPAQNLAFEELLFHQCESGAFEGLLWLWEPKTTFVVMGYGNKADSEVNLLKCAEDSIPVIRRLSGGGTVLQGQGCLNYSLFLRIDYDPALTTITGSNRWILTRIASSLNSAIPRHGSRDLGLVEIKGDTDLAIQGVKFCGSAQKRGRESLLFHGCFLLDFPIEWMELYLRHPSREPSYREGRSHGEFVRNLSLGPGIVKEALVNGWQALTPLRNIPCLPRDNKFETSAWNLRD